MRLATFKPNERTVWRIFIPSFSAHTRKPTTTKNIFPNERKRNEDFFLILFVSFKNTRREIFMWKGGEKKSLTRLFNYRMPTELTTPLTVRLTGTWAYYDGILPFLCISLRKLEKYSSLSPEAPRNEFSLQLFPTNFSSIYNLKSPSLCRTRRSSINELSVAGAGGKNGRSGKGFFLLVESRFDSLSRKVSLISLRRDWPEFNSLCAM